MADLETRTQIGTSAYASGNGYVNDGLTFTRRYTHDGVNPLDEVKYSQRKSVIKNRETGGILFQLDNIEAPESWSQLAVDIAAEKYFRQPEDGVETSVRAMVNRVTTAIHQHGVERGYFATEKDGEVFRDELAHILINQKASFNSPVWFNVGLAEQYGITGKPSGNWFYDPKTKKVRLARDTYSHPQASACFIQYVDDDLLRESGMMELQTSEVRLFKQGSGTGSNFSTIRSKGERLSGGGYSGGVIPFLNGFNAWGGSIKSGGTTRRAAKMVILDEDHPEIFDYVNWKLTGELMARDLIRTGRWPRDYEGIVYSTVPGQNSNNSVRLTDEFMRGLDNPDATFETVNRMDGKVRAKYKVKDLWSAIVNAAWECGDPGLQFDTVINDWHTSPRGGRIRGSNPCSEYMFLDDTACNLASINLIHFWRPDGTFDIEGYKHTIDIVTSAQEILVSKSSFPTKRIARNSEDYRPLGLGYSNLGAVLMRMGLPYDSDEAETITGGLTAILTGEAYLQSAKIAGTKIGPFNKYEKNKEPFLRVIEKHRQKVSEIKKSSDAYNYLIESAESVWDAALELGEQNGYRNAQMSVIAPTGTISLQMDCDTTGIEPDYAYVKVKKLAGGGITRIVNQSIPVALSRLGYDEETIKKIGIYAAGHGTEERFLKETPHLREEHYKEVEKAQWNRAETLEKLGYSEEQVKEMVDYIDGHQTIEGAPGIKEEHLAIFDTANKAGDGKRFISPMGHIRIMAAAQPFISGAISKTINLPNDATRDHVAQVYLEGWRRGLKSIALYRDGSKWSQPLNSRKATSREDEAELEEEVSSLAWGERRKLENRTLGIRQKFKIGNRNYYVRTGEYPDGTLGEIFLDAHKGGAEWKAVLGLLSFAISKGMQYGMPLEEVVEDWMNVQAQPRGGVQGYDNIKMAGSIFDFVGRFLGLEYLGNRELATEPDRVDEEGLRYRQVDKMKKAMELLSGNGKEKPAIAVVNEGGNKPKKNEQPREKVKKLSGSSDSGPPCANCGGDTVKTGSCFTCINCGINGGCG